MNGADAGNDILKTVFRKNADVVSRKIAGEFFLIPIRGNIADMQKIFTLNPVAEYIWRELDEEKTLGDIRNGIMHTFEVEEDQANCDIREFIGELLNEALVGKKG